MSVIPYLGAIEARFLWAKAERWIERDYGRISIYLCTVYLALVYFGRRWMGDKRPFSLRRPLIMWNAGLAVFSIIVFLTLFPTLATNLLREGFVQSVCVDWLRSGTETAHVDLWCMLFLLSKMLELGDTAFIVLRKTPLNFLHCYHHVTVLLYGAGFAAPATAASNWFASANCFVHSIMYSYYMLKAAGHRVPRAVSQTITTLQLAQFVLSLAVVCTAYVVKTGGQQCDASYNFLHVGLFIYGTYLILFANFFLQRYVFMKK